MDTGHYNCRDYYISPHFAPTTINGSHPVLPRDETFQELELRCRSPASTKPKFPLLKLPLEIRQQVFSYLLPYSREFRGSNPLASHARNFSAVKKREQRGMRLPQPSSQGHSELPNVVWQRGNVTILRACRQIHNECAEMMYGDSTFLLFVTFAGVTFRYRWLLPSGLAPTRPFDILATMPPRYLRLIKRSIIHVDHVDSYTGMIKFNISGKGLAHGIRGQVQGLVNALKPIPLPRLDDVVARSHIQGKDHVLVSHDQNRLAEDRTLSRLVIRVSNGNAVLDSIKSQTARDREHVGSGSDCKIKQPSIVLRGSNAEEGGMLIANDLKEVLEPFGELRGVRDVTISGAVTEAFAAELRERMMSTSG